MSPTPTIERLLARPAAAPADSAEVDRRVRLITICTAVIVAVGAPFMAIYAAMGIPVMSIAIAVTIALAVTNVFALRRHRSIAWGGHLAITFLYAILFFSNVLSGGFYDPNFAWFYVLPVASAMLIEVRAGGYWALVTIATVVGFWAIDQAGVRWEPWIPEAMAPYQALANRLSVAIAIGGLVIFYAARQVRTERAIRSINSDLLQESRNLHALRAISDAANSATSVEDALDLCIAELTHVERWRAGHAYRVSESGGLEMLDPLHVARTFEERVDPQRLREAMLTLDPGLLRVATATREPQWELLAGAASSESAHALGLAARAVAPVTIGDEVTLLLEVVTDDPTPPRPASLDLLAHAGNQLGRVIERTRAEDRIRDLAFFDGLTGLPNRELFQQSLATAIRAADRTRRSVGLIFIDLDRFKIINDTLGHGVGDQLLRRVARRLSSEIRPTDSLGRVPEQSDGTTISRLGGDEFTVVLSDIENPQAIATVARRILRSFDVPFDLGEHEIFVDASLGIATYPTDGEDAETLLRKADTAMYEAKRRGGGTFEFFSHEMNALGWRRLKIESALRTCLEREELDLHYQPLIDARTQRVRGVEALLRWNHPELGPIPPGEAIQTAEATGLILPIGDWVLDRACRDLAEWHAAGFPLRLSVNLSARQLRRANFVGAVSECLERHRLDPEMLEIEITESLLMVDEAVAEIAKLRELGIRIAIDDFGTGYSSLARLRRLPVDRLKIDRSFVSALDGTGAEVSLAQGMIAMARSLDLQVTAEGVETAVQAQLLVELGCCELQGFLYSRPLPADELTAALPDLDGAETRPASFAALDSQPGEAS